MSEHRCFGAAVTHAAVQQLSALLVAALLADGVPAVSVSPLASWNTICGPQHVASSNWPGVQHCLSAGLVPVLHGDVALDSDAAHHTCILSGDELMVGAASALPLSMSVFVSGVDGLYDRPPQAAPQATPLVQPQTAAGAVSPPPAPGALRRIARAIAAQGSAHTAPSLGALVFADGQHVAVPAGGASAAFEATADSHDVTGGIAGKISCALQVAQACQWRPAGVPVLLTGVHAGSDRLVRTLEAAVRAATAQDSSLAEAILAVERSASGTMVLPKAIGQLLGD